MLNIDDLKSKIEELSRDLERKQKEYNSLFEEMNTGFAFHKIICNKQGDPVDYVFLKVNREFERQTNLNSDDILGRTALEVFPHTDQNIISTYGEVAIGGEPVRFELYLKDIDKYFDVNAYSPFKNFFVTTFYDITRRKKADILIAESEWKYRTVFENMSEGMVFNEIVRDEESEISGYRILDVNKAYETIAGISRGEILGKDDSLLYGLTVEELKNGLHDSDLEKNSLKFEFTDEFNRKSYQISLNRLEKDKFSTIYTDVTEIRSAMQKVENTSKQLQQQNEAYVKLNKELQKTNEDLTQAKNKAEQSDHLKSAFLANMSHEIRTPMNGILGYTEILFTEEDADKRKNYLQIIRNSSHQLLRIVNDIIDISKIESGLIDIHISDLNIPELFQELKDFFDHEAGKKGIELRVSDYLGDTKVIRTDALKVNQILNNLLNNAIKFTDQGYVELTCTLENDEYVFKVRDSGIGINVQDQNLIFDRFRQVELNEEILRGGNGLGLAISKAFVEKMGGRIWVISKPGAGSEFFFTIPVEQA